MNSDKNAPRLVMHIGPHKTATSYLQYNFHALRSDLARLGWLYPEAGARVRTAHHDLSDQRRELDDSNSGTARKLAEIGQEARRRGLGILLSSERFRHFKPRNYARVMDLTGAGSQHVVYAIRDPLDHFYAQWMQITKNGREASLPEIHARHFINPVESPLLNPALEIEPAMRATGATATVLLYDQIVAQGLDIFTVFAEQALGLPGLAPISSTPRNPRIPIELTEFIRALIPAAGHERSGTAIKIGTAFSLVTSKSQQDEIVRTIAEQAPEARRVLKVNRAASGLIPIERQVIHQFGSSLYPAPPEPNRLFRKEEAEWVYYDSEALRQNPVVGPLLQRTLTRIDGKSLAMRSVNAAYGAVIAFRRWRKGLLP